MTGADRGPGHFSVSPFKFLPPLFWPPPPWQRPPGLPFREIEFLARLRLLITPLVNTGQRNRCICSHLVNKPTNKMSSPQRVTRPSVQSVPQESHTLRIISGQEKLHPGLRFSKPFTEVGLLPSTPPYLSRWPIQRDLESNDSCAPTLKCNE